MKHLLIIVCSLFALNVFSTEIVKVDESTVSLWGYDGPDNLSKVGVLNMASFLSNTVLLTLEMKDTIPVIDSVVYEKIGGDFYKREYTSEYAIFYTMPEDSTSLDADSVGFDLILDSLYREFDVADRRIDRLRNRIELERENKRELRNQILDATIRQRELLKIRRRYYRQL